MQQALDNRQRNVPQESENLWRKYATIDRRISNLEVSTVGRDSGSSLPPQRRYLTVEDRTSPGPPSGHVDTVGELVELGEKLLNEGFVKSGSDRKSMLAHDGVFVNRLIVSTWPLFCAYLLSQPWLSNYMNDTYYDWSADQMVFARNGSIQGNYKDPRPMCDTPAHTFHCTDGQNFTELALKHRKKLVGCGCGQGFLGEGLCPMTFYGYTLSDFVSTEPGIALMLGLGFFPLYGTWRNTMMVNEMAQPSMFIASVHVWSMVVFQLSYLAWGVASDCIFPNAHAVLTVAFLGSFLVHWLVTAHICILYTGLANAESIVTTWCACFAVGVISLGAIPRIFLTLNQALDVTWFPNWNYGLGSYAFWFAEASGLSVTFGAYPIILIVSAFKPEWTDIDRDGSMSAQEKALFSLSYAGCDDY